MNGWASGQSDFVIRLATLFGGFLVLYSVYTVVRYLSKELAQANIAALAVGVAYLIPDVDVGFLSPSLAGALLGTLMYASYIRWLRSTKTTWAFGTSDKNYRWLVLSAALCAVLVFSVPYLSLLTAPWFYLIWTRRSRLGAFSFTAFSIVIFWVMYSYTAPRGVLSLMLDSVSFSLRYHSIERSYTIFALLAGIIIAVLAIAIARVNRNSIQQSKLIWIGAISIILTVLVLRTGVLNLTLPLAVAAVILLGYRVIRMQKFILPILIISAVTGYAGLLLQRSSSYYVSLQADQAKRQIGDNTVYIYDINLEVFKNMNLAQIRYLDAQVLSLDDQTSMNLIDTWRGDMQEYAPQYVILAHSTNVPGRVQEYLDDHYETAEVFEDFSLLERISF